jgi:hypothetical protein
MVFKSPEGLYAAAGAGPPADLLALIEQRMADVTAGFATVGATWEPEEHGAFVLVEPGDNVRDFRAVGLNPEDDGLIGATWEICWRHPALNVYEVLILYSGDTGWTFFVPDEPWLDPQLRAKLADEAVEALPATGAGNAEVPF